MFQSFGPPHFGQGGSVWTDETVISLPQFVQLYVPAETSLPMGAGFAMHSSLEDQYRLPARSTPKPLTPGSGRDTVSEP